MCTLSIAEYENEGIPKILLTAEEPLSDQSTDEHSERETNITDHQGQIIVPATTAMGQVHKCSYLVLTGTKCY